jgi:hypothetical protein
MQRARCGHVGYCRAQSLEAAPKHSFLFPCLSHSTRTHSKFYTIPTDSFPSEETSRASFVVHFKMQRSKLLASLLRSRIPPSSWTMIQAASSSTTTIPLRRWDNSGRVLPPGGEGYQYRSKPSVMTANLRGQQFTTSSTDATSNRLLVGTERTNAIASLPNSNTPFGWSEVRPHMIANYVSAYPLNSPAD